MNVATRRFRLATILIDGRILAPIHEVAIKSTWRGAGRLIEKGCGWTPPQN
jgi:hypothetical protein